MSDGLNFSDGFSSDYVKNNKSTFRKAGDAFNVGSGNNITNSTTNNTSNSNSAYDTWLSYMGNQNNQSNNQSQSSSSSGVNGWTPKSEKTNTQPQATNSTSNSANTSGSSTGFSMAPPKSGERYYADKAEVKAAWNGVYDEDKYRYYEGKDGVSTGADAYHTDMANYQAQLATSGDNPHLGLVNSMMHPDWKDHNFNGTYGQINQNADYSQRPTGAGYGPGGKKEGIFGGR